MCSIRQSLVLFFVFIAAAYPAVAQLPACHSGGTTMFYSNSSGIYNYDPSMPLSSSNPVKNTIPYPSGASGLAVSAHLANPGAGATFYTVRAGTYHYYDGVGWVNTNHSIGSPGAINIGAGGGYIFGLDPSNNKVFRYDGTGNAVLIASLSGPFNGIADLVVDCNGNFYVLNTFGSQFLKKYDSAGVLIYTWPLIGIPSTNGGGGFSIIDDKLYYTNDINSNFFVGQITCNAVLFSAPYKMSWSLPPADFAECTGCFTELTGKSKDFFFCGRDITTQIVAKGKAPYSWSILSGAALITGTGPVFNVKAAATTTLIFNSSSICGPLSDTFRLILPRTEISADTDTIKGCGSYIDTLHAQVTHNPEGGISLNYQWTPASYILSGANSPDPVINPPTDTTFVLLVSTSAAQGGCSWKDTFRAVVTDRSVVSGFVDTIRYGCNSDTVHFHAQSSGASSYLWIFGDGSPDDTAQNPVHVFNGQISPAIKLVSYNETCRDTAIRTLDLDDGINAAFVVSEDSICQGGTISFYNNSVFDTAKGASQFLWYLGDGTQQVVKDVQHMYTLPGTYKITLVGKSFSGCTDTFRRVVTVDPLPLVSIVSDSVLCAGQHETFLADYTREGNAGITWDFGNGKVIDDQDACAHAYSSPGRYAVLLAAKYRHCPDQTVSREVTVTAPPDVNLGKDTAICKSERSFVIGLPHTEGAGYQWNNGQTSSSVLVTAPGLYFLEVDIDGCRNSDTIEITTYTCECKVSIPNAFSPNNDARNDIFRAIYPADCSIKGFNLAIYNRWGQQVFSTADPARGWDGVHLGAPAEMGTYYYTVTYYVDSSPQPITLKGDLILIR